MTCHYQFMPTTDMPPRADRFELVLVGGEGPAVQIQHHGTGQVFPTADAVSEFLLVPVLTGRPR
jgi:hypothetical protein